MKHETVCRRAALMLLCLGALPAFAATVWDEALAGDFSNDGLAPTAVFTAVGSNVVLGTTGNAGAGVDRDYLRFTVPDGARLSSLVLLANSTISGGSSFIGIQSGPQLTVLPSGEGSQNLLGFAHYSNDQIGLDLLPLIAAGSAGSLPAGTYSVWVQELGGPVSYGFDFVMTAVPEPVSAALLLAGLAGLALVDARRGPMAPH